MQRTPAHTHSELGFWRSRLWESNPRPFHYEARCN
nr:MAG TPA: hypothetical protein [Caudoviricetes sp.]